MSNHPKARKERLRCPLSARRLAHVHYQHEHLRTRYSFEDRTLRLAERFFGACGYCQRSAGPRVLQRDLLPDTARCACDENDFAVVCLGSV